jgi:hypothetical protein
LMMANVHSIFWRLYSADFAGHPAELVGSRSEPGEARRDPDLHKGALEGDRPGDEQNVSSDGRFRQEVPPEDSDSRFRR